MSTIKFYGRPNDKLTSHIHVVVNLVTFPKTVHYMHKNYFYNIVGLILKISLTLSQTTNFRPFQTERGSGRQFQI